MSVRLTKEQAKALWIHAQRLDEESPFGKGAKATKAAVEHLGYVQIDTINVIERSHHHILFNRIPDYKREDLFLSQSKHKTVFEYWTHALSYVPTKDYRYFLSSMNQNKKNPSSWFAAVKKQEMQKVLKMIKTNGPISIRDVKDDVLVEKTHPWASKKPSKKALQLGFYNGTLVISERQGMLKKYELADRHFDWSEKPKAATEAQILEYRLDRALRSQSFVNLDSICHLVPSLKPQMRKLIEKRVRKNELVPVSVDGIDKIDFWMRPEELDLHLVTDHGLTHILSPFDPLVILRKRLSVLFDYDHLFEAYLPKQKRVLGYFALPVLMDNKIVAAIDLKTDRQNKDLLVQQWTWFVKGKSPALKKRIDEELHRFEKFQLCP